ncbi:MAG: hypothetical protein JRJ85_02335 [Deltaproteobacteria bacterium]|nr:hypothetical protein [Deltaproteobacteria bacterium]
MAIKKIVADSTALILLAKCSLLEIVCKLLEVVVPLTVLEETASEDLSANYADAFIIRDLFSRGLFSLASPNPAELQMPFNLHRGEADALMLAKRSPGAVCATDDGKAIKAARFLKIPFIITPEIVVSLYKLEEIPFAKARQSIEKLGKIGRYSPEIIAESILSLTEARNGKAHNNKNT